MRYRTALTTVVVIVLGTVAWAGTDIDRFLPGPGRFSLYAPLGVTPHPDGSVYFALVDQRLLCTVDTASAQIRSIYDLGPTTARTIRKQPQARMTVSDSGKLLALTLPGQARFFDIRQQGRLELRSSFDAPLVAGLPVLLDNDGEIAILTVRDNAHALVSVRTSNAHALDQIAFATGVDVFEVAWSVASSTLVTATSTGITAFKVNESGKLKEKGGYARRGFVGGLDPGLVVAGPDGRVFFTIEENGSALIGVNSKGKQTTMAAAVFPERYSAPVRASANGRRVSCLTVAGDTGLPSGVAIFEAEGRKLRDRPPRVISFAPEWGVPVDIAFDGSGTFLVMSFPGSNLTLLADAATGDVLDTMTAMRSPMSARFTAGSRIVVAGSGDSVGWTALGSCRIATVGVSKQGFDLGGVRVLDELEATVFDVGDRCFAFGNLAYALVISGNSDRLQTFVINFHSEVTRLDLGASTGFLAMSPDRRKLVVSAGGGLMVVDFDEAGGLSPRAAAVPGAAPDPLTPSAAFHPNGRLAYVTAGSAVWMVDLDSGAVEAVLLAPNEQLLSNPAVSSSGGELYFLQGVNAYVICELDADGRPTSHRTVGLVSTTAAEIPVITYDVAGGRFWLADATLVRQYALATGALQASTAPLAVRGATVLVGDNLLVPTDDAVAIFDVGGDFPLFRGNVALPEPGLVFLPGAVAATDAATGVALFPFPEQARIVRVRVHARSAEVVEAESAAGPVAALGGAEQIAYVDTKTLSGAAVVTRLLD